MLALHFGAGNIGRGFIGQLLHEAGYDICFADVNQTVIDDINNLIFIGYHDRILKIYVNFQIFPLLFCPVKKNICHPGQQLFQVQFFLIQTVFYRFCP